MNRDTLDPEGAHLTNRPRSGLLHGGLPYAAAGSGPPVVVLPGLSGDPADARGQERRMNLRLFRRLTGHFTVYVVNVKPGLPADSTLHDAAERYADAFADEFDQAVPVIGVSTGGSIAQCLAVDHPDRVERLVLLASACQLSPYGRRVQRTLAQQTRAGRPRRAWAATAPALAATPLGTALFTGLMVLTGNTMTAHDPDDLLTMIGAEDAFDAGPDLHRISAPTLVIGGGRDRYYSPELFRKTARQIPSARLALYPRKGHFGTITHQVAIQAIHDFLTLDLGPGHTPRIPGASVP
jgi:pimeloyl-ACP methyl ester carboxylesterase